MVSGSGGSTAWGSTWSAIPRSGGSSCRGPGPTRWRSSTRVPSTSVFCLPEFRISPFPSARRTPATSSPSNGNRFPRPPRSPWASRLVVSWAIRCSSGRRPRRGRSSVSATALRRRHRADWVFASSGCSSTASSWSATRSRRPGDTERERIAPSCPPETKPSSSSIPRSIFPSIPSVFPCRWRRFPGSRKMAF